ncbi:MAG TPA: Na/Pi cotransporter family protein [bacterium]|nr:Na/Pi cotransporter family protein [bacterium]
MKKFYLTIFLIILCRIISFSYQIQNLSFKPGQTKFSAYTKSEIDTFIIIKLVDENKKAVENETIYFQIIKIPEKAKNYKLFESEIKTNKEGIVKNRFITGDREGEYLILVTTPLVQNENLILTIEAKKITWGIELFFGLIGGLAMFLYGISMMGDALTKIGGKKLSTILNKLTSNKYLGIIVGTIVTTIFQSSTATTVMVVGLINSNLMNLTQSIGIILGANIGATTTPQIVAFRLTDYAIFFIGIGFLISILGKTQTQKLNGSLIMGVGLLLYGIKIMSDIMYPLRTYQPLIQYMRTMENPIMGVIVGTIFTALIQSSGAAISIFITLAFQGVLTLKAALPLTFGANIGTCITAYLASLNSKAEAKRAAWAHILFNFLTTIIFLPFLEPFQNFIEFISSGQIQALTHHDISLYVPRQIANANTIAKIIAVVIFLPFTKHLEKMCILIIPYKTEPVFKPKYLDESVLILPATALNLVKREIIRMLNKTKEIFEEVILVLEKKDNKLANQLIIDDDKIDLLEESIKSYLSKISQKDLSAEDANKHISYLYIVEYIEHISDIISKEMMPLALKLINNNLNIYSKDFANLKKYNNFTNEMIEKLLTILKEENINLKLVDEIITQKVESIKFENEIKKEHYTYLCQNINEASTTTSIFIDLLNCYRAINSNISSIAYILKGEF